MDQTDLTKGLILLDFWAPWCGPCKSLKPVVEQIDSDRDDIFVYKSNIDETPDLARKYKVKSVPCFILLKDGEEQKRISGITSKQAILDMLV